MNRNQLPLYTFIALIFFSSCEVLKPRIEKQANKQAQQDGVLEAMAFEREKTQDPNTGSVPTERLMDAYNYAQTLRQSAKKTRGPVSDVNWSERGPNNVGGRTRALMYDLNDATKKTVWAGSVGGGLWKTIDITAAPPVWTKINDFFDNLAITSLVQHPVNRDTMYFSTGEGFGNSDAIRGQGIWRTVDGGVNWTQLPSTANSSFYYTNKLAISNNGILYAATRDGLYKSSNHGSSWTQVLANGVSGGSSDFTTDVEIGADGDIYAGFGPEIFKSDNAVHGVNKGNVGTWTDISPPGTYTRSEIFTAPSDSTRVYAMVHDGGSPGIYRSVNGGAVWTAAASAGFCDQGTFNADFTRSQAWYDLIGAVDPNAPATIYIGGVDGLKSTDGGATWTQITSWTGGANGACSAPSVYVHADHHAIVFEPGSSTNILWGTDGGIFRTTNAGTSFTVKNTGYNVTQYYACAAHPTNANYFLAGSQDNGTQKFTTPGINTTSQATGGDGAFCHIDQTNGNIQLTSYVYNSYYVSNNGGASFSSIPGGASLGRFINPTDYDDVNDIQYGSNNNGIYEIITGVGVTNTRATRNISATTGARKLCAVTVDPNTPSTVWMAFQVSNLSTKFYRVDNAATASPTVTELSAGLPSSNGIYLSNIDVEKGNSNHILITYSNFGVNSVWESTNGGSSWTSVEGNLPDMPIRWAMIHPDSSDMAFVATDLGVWSTNNLNGASTNWAPTNNGFANVRVDMLQFRESDNTLVAATHGRGLFTATLPHTPKLNFGYNATTISEIPQTTVGCRRFKDYTVDANISYPPTTPVIVNINVAGGATATEFMDYEYTTNGSFITPSHQAVFNNAVTTVPVTVRVYDDQTWEAGPETFTLQFNVVSGLAVPGTIPTSIFTLNDNSDNPLLKRVSIVTEDFESGVNPPAGWTLVGANSNRWGNKNYLGCPSTINNYTMQAYRFSLNTCGYNINSTSTAIVYRPVNATGYSSLQASFDWVGEGEAGYDYAELVYSTNTVTPSWVVVPGSPVMGNTLTVTNSVVNLPAALNNTTFLLGWRWVNDSNTGDSPVGFDNVVVSGELSRTIETVLSNDNEYLGPNGDIYIYHTDGDLMARIQNLGNFNYGCTQVNIDRAGVSAQFLLGETDVLKKVFDKTLLVVPANNNPSGNIAVTLYVTNAERAGFEAQGRTWAAQGKLFKTAGPIMLAATNTPRDFATNLSQGSYLNGYFIRGEFSNGFSGFGIGDPGPATGIPLATHILTFTGSMKDQIATLFWNTTSESNLLYYEIERSTDGVNFKTVGNKMAMNEAVNAYSFEDAGLQENKYYYRLKAVQVDQGFEYSNVLVLLVNESDDVVIYPNPMDGRCTVYTAKRTLFSVLNTQGQVMRRIDVQGSMMLDMESYPAGVYYLKNSANSKVYKIVKK